jgi:two-component system nitrate/nitrite response regulator NarL
LISVIVVVEVRLYREAVVRALSAQDDLRVRGELASAGQVLLDVTRAQPDVVLLDLGMPRALDAIAMARLAAPDTRIVALGFGGTDEEAVIAAEAGLSGYIGINQPLDEVVTAIRGVVRGEAPCDGRIAAALLRRVAGRAATFDSTAAPLAGLTARERRILELLAGGMSNKEIASELVIGVATVKSHVHAILRKLDVSRRGAAADVFRRSQLVRA